MLTDDAGSFGTHQDYEKWEDEKRLGFVWRIDREMKERKHQSFIYLMMLQLVVLQSSYCRGSEHL